MYMKSTKTIALTALSSLVLLTACSPAATDQSATSSTASSAMGSQTITSSNDSLVKEVIQQGDKSYQVYTEIIIDATPEEVWSVLTDFDQMSSWSSSLQTITGIFENGQDVDVINGTG